MMMPRVRSRFTSEDAGLTVVELLVVMSVLAVVSAIAVTGLIQGMQTTRYSQDRADALHAAQVGIERMSRELRAADPLRTVDNSLVTFDIRRDGRLYHYRYEVESSGGDDHLVQEVWGFDNPDADPLVDTPNDETESVLVRDLARTNVFEFFDASGEDTTIASEVRRVQIVIEREVDGTAEPILVQTIVKVRNA